MIGDAMRSPEGFFAPEPRLKIMDELGLDRALMWPTLASLLEERLADDPKATHVVVHTLNEWMHEHWSFNYEGRIFPTPVITLPIVSEAIKELEWVLERGAKIILIRPAPVPGYEGRRSFALPEFDPFWAKVAEADIAVGMHASDDGMTRYYNDWNGTHGGELLRSRAASRPSRTSRTPRAEGSSTRSRRSSGTACSLASRRCASCPSRTGRPGYDRSSRPSRTPTSASPTFTTKTR